jgi:hypothetical protein
MTFFDGAAYAIVVIGIAAGLAVLVALLKALFKGPKLR